jgi:mono/diheme cytochrome c family protein
LKARIAGCNDCHTPNYPQSGGKVQWVQKGKSLNARPPMPWFNVRDMSTSDLRAIYRYVRHLGPAGRPAPAFVPPSDTSPGLYVQFPSPK